MWFSFFANDSSGVVAFWWFFWVGVGRKVECAGPLSKAGSISIAKWGPNGLVRKECWLGGAELALI